MTVQTLSPNRNPHPVPAGLPILEGPGEPQLTRHTWSSIPRPEAPGFFTGGRLPGLEPVG